MDFKDYFLSMSPEDRAAYAERAETSVKYISIHLVTKTRIPRPELMQKLTDAAEGAFSYRDLVEFFYPEAA